MTDAELAQRIVIDAGSLARDMRAEGLVAERKTSIADIVTAADREAEALVARTLAAERPDDGLLGEEGQDRPSRSGRRWICDPVDGTYNFHAGLDPWCSAIALEDAGELVLGAVHAPATGRTWVGGAGLPSSVDGVALPRLVDRPLAECALGTFIRPGSFDDDGILRGLRAAMRSVATARNFGSGTSELMAVAEGRLGVWIQHDTPAWDWLPGRAVVEGAGGRSVELEHAGHTWHIAGNPRAVGELADAILAS